MGGKFCKRKKYLGVGHGAATFSRYAERCALKKDVNQRVEAHTRFCHDQGSD
jgi:hypothetical protein